LPKNVGDLGKSIVAEGYEKLPKVQKIARSGHTAFKINGDPNPLVRILIAL